MGSTGESTEPAARRSCRPQLVRDLTLVAVLFMVVSVWRSHRSLQKQFQTLYEASQELLLVYPPPSKPTIGYAISMTACDPERAHLDGAAVLRYSIRRFNQKYDSKFYAFVHPDAKNCSADLEKMGYEVQVRPTPLNTSDIRGPLTEFVEKASCCGSKEFLKLYSYILTEHPVVVHLDMDVAIFQPLDDLFDSMLEGPNSLARRRLPAMWTNNVTDLPEQIDAFFTRDYNMLSYAGYRKPIETSMQGGFLVVRPNATVFQEFIDTILEGKYDAGFGWGAPELRFGGTYGSAQIQGLVTYYYGHLHPNTSVELNRCKYNTMVDTPVDEKGKCLAPRADGYCEDCRETNFSEVKTTHYTICQKPWLCYYEETRELCRKTHQEWFRLRWDMEMEFSKDPSYNMTGMNKKFRRDDVPWVVNGNWSFCKHEGDTGYIKLRRYPS